jgi:hypothetical protein
MERIRRRDLHLAHEWGRWGKLGTVPHPSTGRSADRHGEGIETAITSVSPGANVGPKSRPVEVEEAWRRVNAPAHPWNHSHRVRYCMEHLDQSEDCVVIVNRATEVHLLPQTYSSG